MGFLERMRTMMKAQANAFVDAKSDPAKQLAQFISQIEDGMKQVTADLLTYKAHEKLLGDRVKSLDEQIVQWEKRAEGAVTAGDDALARQALVEKHRLETERTTVQAERAEQGQIAADMLKARRELVQQLTSLKLRQGTIAQGLAAARGKTSPLATQGGAFEAFDRVGDKLEDKAALDEVDLELDGAKEVQEASMDRRLKEGKAELELAALKEKMKK
jgi:phage shock protein A